MTRDTVVEVARLLFARDGHSSTRWDDLDPALRSYWLTLAVVWLSTHDWAAVEARARSFTLTSAITDSGRGDAD